MSKFNYKTINVSIKISEECKKRLLIQLNGIKVTKIPEFEDVKTLEGLISRLLEHWTHCNDQCIDMQSKMQDVIEDLSDRGVDIVEIFHAINKKVEELQKIELKKIMKKN